MPKNRMIEELKQLHPLRWAPVSPETDKGVELLKTMLDFEVFEYASGAEVNGWVVPQSWYPVKAEIRKDGELIYDGMRHPLGVIGYSSSFQGKVSLEELKQHLFSRPARPNALVYHFRLYYRNAWDSNWGFSMPWNQVQTLPEGEYEVDLQTVHEPGTMKVLEATLPGETTDTIALTAHNCHAAQSNDDLVGVVAGMEIMRHLAELPKRRYTYRLIIGAEHFGPVFYLANRDRNVLDTFRGNIFLEVLGHQNRLALQRSFNGDTILDRAAEHVLKHRDPRAYVGDFRKVIGNDEVAWEAPGYEIPTILLTRAEPMPLTSEGVLHFPEYHTSMDNPDIIQPEMLEDAVEATLAILDVLETNTAMERKFDGLVALSNPTYDLYINTLDASKGEALPEVQFEWFNLMDRLPRYLDGSMTILDIALKHDLPYDQVKEYILRWEEKKLLQRIKN